MLLQDCSLIIRHLLVGFQWLSTETELSKLIQQGLRINNWRAKIVDLIWLVIKLMVLDLLRQRMSKTLKSVVLVNLHLKATLNIRQSIYNLDLFRVLGCRLSSMLWSTSFRTLGINQEIRLLFRMTSHLLLFFFKLWCKANITSHTLRLQQVLRGRLFVAYAAARHRRASLLVLFALLVTSKGLIARSFWDNIESISNGRLEVVWVVFKTLREIIVLVGVGGTTWIWFWRFTFLDLI